MSSSSSTTTVSLRRERRPSRGRPPSPPYHASKDGEAVRFFLLRRRTCAVAATLLRPEHEMEEQQQQQEKKEGEEGEDGLEIPARLFFIHLSGGDAVCQSVRTSLAHGNNHRQMTSTTDGRAVEKTCPGKRPFEPVPPEYSIQSLPRRRYSGGCTPSESTANTSTSLRRS